MPIVLDPFQKEAIEEIEKEHSVLVSAPTGAGKTLIAEAAIEKALSRDEQVAYTAPIKALSNQKYRDFRARFGDEKVGILTGDVAINVDAPILIMTTEIYRNSLFEYRKRMEKLGWVIFDEIHYLDDIERGTVWEEALLFTPPEIRILALSATAPNIEQLAEWIQSIHNRPVTVIHETHRPVPLHFFFQCQGRILETTKQLQKEGYLNRDNWRMSFRQRRHHFHPLRAKPNRLDPLLHHIVNRQRTPLIYFVFGRRRSEELAWETLSFHFNFLTEVERKQITALFQSLLERYDLISERSAVEMRPLIELGVAYHHAGMLPTLKEVIEQLFTSRLIKLIFTTETFALGINMPARSVIFDELEKYYGTGFRALTTRDFYQMAGRAGRRGMDEEGFVYVRVHPPYIAYSEVSRILYGSMEPIRSQFNTAYATLLNLYREYGRKLLEIYPKTFHSFQSRRKKQKEAYELIERKLSFLEELGYLTSEGLTQKGEFASSLFGFELMLAEAYEEGLLENLRETELTIFLAALVYEPRKGAHLPRLMAYEKLRKQSAHMHRHIHRMETKYRIHPYTKLPHFNLTPAIEAWTNGVTFDRLFELTSTDEGELVRYIRMVIQLLRELLHAPNTPEVLRAHAQNARTLINRDVVDAEKQLRV